MGKDATLASNPGLDLGSLTRIAVKPAPAAAPSAQLQQQQQQQGALAASAAQAVQTPQSVADIYAGMATSQARSSLLS